MAQHSTPTAPAQEDIDRAQLNWAAFTKMMKVSVVTIIILLSGMALFLV